MLTSEETGIDVLSVSRRSGDGPQTQDIQLTALDCISSPFI